MQRFWRLRPFPVVLGLILAGSAGLAGCNVLSHRVTRVEHQAFNVPQGGHTALSVTTLNGHVSVTAIGEGSADISVTAFAAAASDADAQTALATIAVSMRRDGDALVVSAEATGADTLAVTRGADVDVMVPPNSDVSVATTNGRIEVVNVKGTITARTTNGEVVARGGSATQIETSNGSITVSQPHGALSAHTTNASVDVLNGDAVVADIQSSNGSVSFSGSLAAGNQSFTTTNAAVGLHLPAGQGFTLQGQTSNANVSSDFSGITATGASLSGTTGDGSARITISTTNGQLSVTTLKP